MAGEVVVRTQLTNQLLGEIISCGFNVTVNVDCSHGVNVKTKRADRPEQSIITKPIELDVSIEGITDDRKLGLAIGKMQNARAHSKLFQFYQELWRVTGSNGGSAGLSVLKQRALKIEFPNFDATIINLLAPVPPIADAIQACNAPNVAAFNLLPVHVRSSMGMYRRNGPGLFALVGQREPNPRTAVV